MNTCQSTVLVIGGGVTGLTSAVHLARQGVSVVITETADRWGGHAAQLACMATDGCVSCGACVVHSKILQALSHPNIQMCLNTRIEAVDKAERFIVRLNQGHEIRQIEADAILVASGFAPYAPHAKPYGYGRFANVLTTLDLNINLRRHTVVQRPSDATAPGRIAFIQCVGSRDSSIHHLWCSRICCGISLRMARRIQHRQPDTEITFFYIDVQTFGKNFEMYYADCQKQICMIRTIPADILETGDDCLNVSYFNPDTQSYQEALFDMVVLSTGLEPSESAGNLAAMLNISPQALNYTLNPESIAAMLPESIFIAGAALEPMSIAESVASAESAAFSIFQYLEPSQVIL